MRGVRIFHIPGWLAYTLSWVLPGLSPTFADMMLHHTSSEYVPDTYRRFSIPSVSIVHKWREATALLVLLFTCCFAHAQVSVRGDSLISLPEGQVQLSKQGFPEQINNLLAENIHFHFNRAADGKDIRLTPNGVHFTKKSAGSLEWNAGNTADELKMEVNATLEADGHLACQVRVTAMQDLDLKDITMHIPFRPEIKWDSTHTGLQYSLTGDSWNNGGKGGTTVGLKGKSMLVNNYSGVLQIKKGDILYYNFNLLITPGSR